MAMTALHLDKVLHGRAITSRPRVGRQRESQRGERHNEKLVEAGPLLIRASGVSTKKDIDEVRLNPKLGKIY
jgi:hypothetical protein